MVSLQRMNLVRFLNDTFVCDDEMEFLVRHPTAIGPIIIPDRPIKRRRDRPGPCATQCETERQNTTSRNP
jgi:hypothetical protein